MMRGKSLLGPFIGRHVGSRKSKPLAHSVGNSITLGPELIVNGSFTTDTDWTKGTGWTITGGVANAAAGAGTVLSQSAGVTNLVTYRIRWTLVSRTAGNARAWIGGTQGALQTVPGTYQEDIVAALAGTIGIIKHSTFAGSVDNVSVREVL